LRRSEIRYRRLFEAARDGILILDPDTRKIIDANPFITKLLGYSKKQLFRKELWEIGLLKDAETSRNAFRQLEKHGFIRYENLPLETKQGQRREVEFVSNLYREDGDRVIQCNVRDITERKRASEALRASEERFRALFTLEPVGVYSCDAAGKLLDFNHCATKLWGRKPKLNNSQERFCGSFRMYRPDGPSVPHRDCPMGQVLSGKLALARNLEAVIERPDGSRITVVVNIVPFRDAQGKITGAINCFYDVTGLKRVEKALLDSKKRLARYAGQLESKVAERTANLVKGSEKYRKLLLISEGRQKKLKHLSHELISIQEEERKKISRDLHDEVVQTLNGLSIELHVLGEDSKADAVSVKQKIVRAQRLVAISASAVHRFARELRPAALDDLGLIPALNSYCESLSEKKALPIHVTDLGGVDDLASDKRTVLYRVAQEALTNVIRHANATEVRISAGKIADSVHLEIKDNGRSFDVNEILASKNNRRLGLIGMKERIEMVGGRLAIASSPGQGTAVRVQIPFQGLNLAKDVKVQGGHQNGHQVS